MSTSPHDEPRTIQIPANHQVSICVPFDGYMTIQCTSGIAEYNGREMPDKLVVDLVPGTRVAVFTYLGATVHVSGVIKFPVHHLSNQTPLLATNDGPPHVDAPTHTQTPVVCANVHVALEAQRKRASSSDHTGPIVLVCGAPDTGKSTVARTLVNYAFKSGRQPVYVDINPENPTISIPGTLALMQITHPVDCSLGLCVSHAAVQTTGLGTWPYVVWHGSDLPVSQYQTAHTQLYHKLYAHLNRTLLDKFTHDRDAAHAGAIIDCPGALDHDTLFELASAFNVNYMVYLTQDGRDVPPPSSPLVPTLQVLPLPAVTGTVPKSRQYRKYMHLHAIREYFYGPMGGTRPAVGRVALTPHNITVPVSILAIHRIAAQSSPGPASPSGNHESADSSKMVAPPGVHVPAIKLEEPADLEARNNNPAMPEDVPEAPVQLTKVADPSTLAHSILAVVDGPLAGEEVSVDEVVASNVLGFVYVSDYKQFRDKLDLLVPFPGRLPTTRVLAGSIKWMELL